MEPSSQDEPSAAIEHFDDSLICVGCFWTVQPRKKVRVIDITQVKAGWLAHGEIRQLWCHSCGRAYTELVQYIPIECATLPCPGCGPGAGLTTEILSIIETETGYSFVAVLKCAACSKQRRFSKLLGGLSKIKKVKVGATGVEVEVKS